MKPKSTVISCIILLLILSSPRISWGLGPSDSLLATFYNQTLTSYFSDTTRHKDQSKYGSILMQTDLDTSKLVKTIGKFKLQFYRSTTSEYEVLQEPYENNQGRSIYVISHQSLGKDTIDINIGGWTLEKINKSEIELALWCGGTMGYLPAARFIYNSENESWTYFGFHKLIEARIKELSKH